MQNLSKIIKIKVNRYAEDYDRSKYLTSITTEEKNKDLLKKYEEIKEKVKNNNSDDNSHDKGIKSELIHLMIYL